MNNPITEYSEARPKMPANKIGAAGRIGLIALATDVNCETDLRRMTPAGVEIFTNRVQNCNPITVANLKQMAGDISRAAGGILPGDDLDVLIYSCTSGSAVLGEATITKHLQAGRGKLPCTNPVSAAVAAFNCLAAKRISILTPYGSEDVNRQLVACFESHGVTVINLHSLGIASDADMGNVSAPDIDAAANTACRADADLLFISCTAMRAAERVAALESVLHKPVITSNQAMLWQALKLIGGSFSIPGFGRLFNY